MPPKSAKSKKSTKKRGKRTKNKEKPDLDIDELFRACNRHGYKEEIAYFLPPSRRYDSTHFLMPDTPLAYEFISDEIATGTIEVDGKDFLRFWSEVADCHKERRFLADYMAALRFFQADFKSDAFQRVKREIAIGLSDDVFWILRRLFVEGNKSPTMRAVIEGLCRSVSTPTFWELAVMFLGEAIRRAYCCAATRGLDSSFGGTTAEISAALADTTIVELISSYFGWISFDKRNLTRYVDQYPEILDMLMDVDDLTQARFMKKMKVAVPHWRKEDRAFILGAIETNGECCQDSYVQRLLKMVGLEKFKRLVFGKEKFCANCGRSSYTGEDRLWCCKLCSDDRIRPKARYCNINCQKAHWLKHKAGVHSTREENPFAIRKGKSAAFK